jgi:hypothetical protein
MRAAIVIAIATVLLCAAGSVTARLKGSLSDRFGARGFQPSVSRWF